MRSTFTLLSKGDLDHQTRLCVRKVSYSKLAMMNARAAPISGEAVHPKSSSRTRRLFRTTILRGSAAPKIPPTTAWDIETGMPTCVKPCTTAAPPTCAAMAAGRFRPTMFSATLRVVPRLLRRCGDRRRQLSSCSDVGFSSLAVG